MVKYILQSSNLIKPIPLIPKPHLSPSNDIVSAKIYDKRDDFDFEIVNFPIIFLALHPMESISHLIFARASSHLTD